MTLYKKILLSSWLTALSAAITYLLISSHQIQPNIASIPESPAPHKDTPEILPHTLSTIQSSLDAILKDIPQLRATIDENKQNFESQLDKLEQAMIRLADTEIVAPPSIENSLTPEEQYQTSIAKAVEEVQLFDEAVDAEERDEGWATQMEDNIVSQFDKELFSGSTFSGIECKTTLCRFEATHEDIESKDNFELIRRELPNSYHIQHFDNLDGTSMSVMYLIKSGEEENSIIFKTIGS